jgi:Protein of unknown function (DUF4019)
MENVMYWPRSTVKAAFILVAILGLASFVISCGSGTQVKNAEQGVNQFHSQLDSEQYQAMYAASDDGLHKTATEADFVSLLQAVHHKLGKIQSSQRRNYQVNYSTGQGTVVTLVYDTNFDGGAGTEQFVWHLRSDQPVLLGYHINSNALIVK